MIKNIWVCLFILSVASAQCQLFASESNKKVKGTFVVGFSIGSVKKLPWSFSLLRGDETNKLAGSLSAFLKRKYSCSFSRFRMVEYDNIKEMRRKLASLARHDQMPVVFLEVLKLTGGETCCHWKKTWLFDFFGKLREESKKHGAYFFTSRSGYTIRVKGEIGLFDMHSLNLKKSQIVQTSFSMSMPAAEYDVLFQSLSKGRENLTPVRSRRKRRTPPVSIVSKSFRNFAHQIDGYLQKEKIATKSNLNCD